jgi:hypothetical protein
LKAGFDPAQTHRDRGQRSQKIDVEAWVDRIAEPGGHGDSDLTVRGGGICNEALDAVTKGTWLAAK